MQEGPKYDARSARGGRGGKVTHVANQWASLIAETKGQNGDRAHAVKDDYLHVGRIGLSRKPSKIETSQDQKKQASQKAPVAVTRPPSIPPFQRLASAPKVAPVKGFVNTTVGKPPTFAAPQKAKARLAAASPMSPAAIVILPSREQAFGPGANKVKALIDRFN